MVKAVVHPLDGAVAGPELERELQEFCRIHLAPIKCPRSIDFVAELTRLPTGKLCKTRLIEQYRSATVVDQVGRRQSATDTAPRAIETPCDDERRLYTTSARDAW